MILNRVGKLHLIERVVIMIGLKKIKEKYACKINH